MRGGVRFMLVGMSAALLQGARGATEDIDLWFEDLSDPRISAAARIVGAIFLPGSLGMRPPGISGGELGDRIGVVTRMHGLRDFATEASHATTIEVDGLRVPVLSLDRIIASKRATGRPKDAAQLPALETALAVIASRDREP